MKVLLFAVLFSSSAPLASPFALSIPYPLHHPSYASLLPLPSPPPFSASPSPPLFPLPFSYPLSPPLSPFFYRLSPSAFPTHVNACITDTSPASKVTRAIYRYGPIAGKILMRRFGHMLTAAEIAEIERILNFGREGKVQILILVLVLQHLIRTLQAPNLQVSIPQPSNLQVLHPSALLHDNTLLLVVPTL